MIDPNKEYQTRDGRPVRILTTDRKWDQFPVVGLILGHDGEERLRSWTSEGRALYRRDDTNDLVERPAKQKGVVVWRYGGQVQFYFLNGNQWKKFKNDPTHLFPDARAVKVVEIEEGEGLG
jgi:hypothetical protein